MNNTIKSKYFFGNEISKYGIENGYVDYRTLAKSFDCILNNDIMSVLENKGFYFEEVNGNSYDEENDSYTDIYQYYIITENGYRILSEYTNEIVYYNDELDLYIWCITHYGTSWDYVLTDIKIDLENE